MCLGNFSKDFTIDNVRKTACYQYIYDFYVDNDTINISDITNTCKYLMKKHKIQ